MNLHVSVYVCYCGYGSTETVWHLASLNWLSLGRLEVMGSFPQWDRRVAEYKQVGDVSGRCMNDNGTREILAGIHSAPKIVT